MCKKGISLHSPSIITKKIQCVQSHLSPHDINSNEVLLKTKICSGGAHFYFEVFVIQRNEMGHRWSATTVINVYEIDLIKALLL